MQTAERLSIDHPMAIEATYQSLFAVGDEHKNIPERIDALSSNDGERQGMRVIYNNKVDALVKAVNELVAFQLEIRARIDDAHMDAAGEAVADLLRPTRNDRFPSCDEQP